MVVDDGWDDAALVAAVLGGEPGAFELLFDRYAPRIHGYCRRMLGDPHTAADATQDTFVAASQRLDQLRDPAALRAWLYAIARNECTKHGRARDRAVPVEDAAVIAEGRPLDDDPAAAAAEAGERAALVWQAADGLDDGDRSLLELQLRHGLEGRELAEAAGVAPGQISMATGRLRGRLERSIGALLVARQGREDCVALQAVLRDWDGTFSVLWRKRVARHLDDCEVCDRRRALLVAPLGALAIVPATAAFALDDLPAGLRERTLAAVAEAGGPVGGGAGGRGRDRRALALAVAGIVAVALLVAAVVAFGGDDGDEQVASGATTTTVASTSTTEVASTTEADEADGEIAISATSIVSDLEDEGAEGGTSTSAVPTTTVPDGPSVTVAPAPTEAPAPPAPDAPPTVSGVVRSGSATLQTSCNPDNATRTVRATVSDDGALATVVLRWSHPTTGVGERAMTRSGSTWSAQLGPFTEVGTVSYRVVAADDAGNVTLSSPATVTVEPCPG